MHLPAVIFAQDSLKHFIFFSRERERIHEQNFFQNPGIVGAQVTYPWRRLEPEKNKYDFSEIEADLIFLQSKGKKLFIQIQDVTFDSIYMAVPPYLISDTSYHGGQSSQYEFKNDDENNYYKAGWVSRRWDPSVAERFHKLLFELAKKFDGRIEGINLPESSVEFGTTGRLFPSGFSYENYRDAIKANMITLKKAFRKSVTIQYINFMPGDGGSGDELRYIQSLYDYAREIGVGVGGPDIKVNNRYQMKNSYQRIQAIHGAVKTGVAVQDGNYSVINPKTSRQVTVSEIFDFARNYLKLNYIFWCTEEPYYSRDVLPKLSTK